MTDPDFTGAPCRDTPELFFPTGDRRQVALLTAEAKKVCRGCPFQRPCLDFAMTQTDGHGRPVLGIWAGTTEGDRDRLRRRRAA